MFVCLLVYLSVCLLAAFLKNFRTDLHEIFREGWQWANEKTIKFWWRSGSGTRIPYCDTSKMCLGGGMHCPNACSFKSNYLLYGYSHLSACSVFHMFCRCLLSLYIKRGKVSVRNVLPYITLGVANSVAKDRNAPLFKLLRGRFRGFSPRRGDTLHRWG